MSSSETANGLLMAIGDEIQKEADTKIDRALQLFQQADAGMQRICLHATGFSGELTLERLRDHFDTLELLDGLDEVIYNLEDDLENTQPTQQ